MSDEELQALRLSLCHDDDTFLGEFHNECETLIPAHFRNIPIYRNRNCFLIRKKPKGTKTYKKPVWIGIAPIINSPTRIVCHPSLVSNWKQFCKLKIALIGKVSN